MLVATHGMKLSIRDIEGPSIQKVVAGGDMLVAITSEHRIRHVASNPALHLREQYWTRVTDVAISRVCEGMCVGLIEDGTCMLAKRALRRITAGNYDSQQDRDREFVRVNDTIKSWSDVIQLAVSDAIFALHKDGTVSCCEFSRPFAEPIYKRIHRWKGVQKLAVGSQCSVVGITNAGTILIDGFNLTHKEEKIVNSCSHLDIADVILCGSECERVLFLDKEGQIWDINGKEAFPGTYIDVLGDWSYTLIARDAEHKLHVLDPGCFHIANEGECEAWGRVASYAILNQGFSQGAVVAVCEK